MIRIQLSNNFQVVELSIEKLDELDNKMIERLINMVNYFGENVKPINQQNTTNKKSEMATEKQINWLKNLDVEIPPNLTKDKANKLIKKYK